MVDILSEIKQDIKQERLENFIVNHWRKFLVFSALALCLTAASVVYKNIEHKNSLEVGKTYYNAFQNKKSDEYLNIIDEKHRGFSPLAALSYASVQVSKNKPELAIKTLDNLIEKNKYDKAFIELAKLNKAALMISLKKPESEIMPILNSLSGSMSIFSLTAKELKANYLIERNKFSDATKILEELAFSENIPFSIQERARKLLDSVK